MAEHSEHEHDGGGHGGGHSHKPGGHGHGGGNHEEHEGAPEWLISFADNVALMMGFFVVLLAMNMRPPSGAKPSDMDTSEPAEKSSSASSDMLDFVIAIREAFNNPVNLNATSPTEQPLRQRMLDRVGAGDAKSLGQKGREAENRSVRPTDYYSLGGKVMFERNSTELSELGRDELQQIVVHLRGLRSIIEVRGHASAAEAYGLDDRGKQISMERALVVARALAETGIDWEHIQIAACGDSDRAVPIAYDQQGQDANQRVEVFVTNFPLPEYIQSDKGRGKR